LKKCIFYVCGHVYTVIYHGFIISSCQKWSAYGMARFKCYFHTLRTQENIFHSNFHMFSSQNQKGLQLFIHMKLHRNRVEVWAILLCWKWWKFAWFALVSGVWYVNFIG
jgi:hypothetical protein